MNVELMNNIERATGRKDKERLLAQADALTREGCRLAVDTFTTFGITIDAGALGLVADAELAAVDAALYGVVAGVPASKRVDSAEWWRTGYMLLRDLAARTYTGNRARDRFVDWCRASPGADHTKWALRIINKDLRCGVSATTVDKVWPGLIETFTVQLAPHDGLDSSASDLGDGFVEPKFDGVRITVIDGVGYTRNGHPLTGIEHVIEALAPAGLRDWVFDGECLDPTLVFDETSGALRRQGGSKLGQGMQLFDVIDRDSWRSKLTPTLMQRKADLAALARRAGSAWGADKPVTPVHGLCIRKPTIDDLLMYRDRFIAGGMEGAMFKPADRPYEFKRSSAYMKIKKWHSMDVTVVDTVEGNGDFAGKLGALVVNIEDVLFNVGTGFTLVEREQLWAVRDTLRGRVVEVKYQNKTAKGKGRFPVYLRMRPDRDPK